MQPGGDDEHQAWIPIMAVARLTEGITEQENWLISQAERI